MSSLIKLTVFHTSWLVIFFFLHQFAYSQDAGDIILAQFDNLGTVVNVDPVTGEREVISRWGERGEGTRMWRPSSIVMAPNGKDVFVADGSIGQGVFRVNLKSGNRTVISGAGSLTGNVGMGPISNPTSIHLSGDEIILVNNGGGSGGFVTRVDIKTGDRTLISGKGIGSGVEFDGLHGGLIADNGDLWVADSRGLIHAVDLQTGDRSIISGGSVGSGEEFGLLFDITLTPDGRLFGISNENQEDTLFLIDAFSGDRTIIETVDSFPEPGFGFRLLFDGNGSLISSDSDALFRIDPRTGHREVITDPSHPGPNLFWGDALVVPVPEPGISILMIVSCLGVLWRKRA